MRLAVHTISSGVRIAAALERFRFEAQALALLTHPGIPRVYAVGQHEGLVYFAMELVEGPTLTTWVQERRLSQRDRVELMARVAEAVHHAHLRGFVHRDLKPDNVRVTADGSPRVLDFGIAAGLGEHRAEIAGTPSYMSPEQFDPSVAVDLRTDVFALGVMLFQVLTGQLPVTVPRGKLATVQALKMTPAPRLRTRLPQAGMELEAIVARALEPRREDRYASAAELADDLRRYLRHEPVLAVQGGRLYRASRFVRRNRALTGIATALATSLLVGATVAFTLFLKAERAAQTATTEAERAKKTAAFLASVLSEADGDNHGGRGATIGQALDHAVEKLDKEALDPHVDSFLRASLANTYVGLGEWHHAEVQAMTALANWKKNGLPDDDEDLAELLRQTSQIHGETGASAEAMAEADRGLAIEEKRHGAAPHPHTSYSLHSAAIGHRMANDFETAIALHRRAVQMERELKALGQEEYVSEALDQSAFTLITCGRIDEARPMLDESLGLMIAQHGPDHQAPAITMAHQSWLEQHGGDLERARALILRVNEIREKTLGHDHMRTAQGYINLAQIDVRLQRWEEAEAALDAGMPTARIAFGDAPGRLGWTEVSQVELWRAQGKLVEAEALARDALARIEKHYGPDQIATIEGQTELAKVLLDLGQRDEARALLQKSIDTSKRIFHADRPRCLVEAEQILASVP